MDINVKKKLVEKLAQLGDTKSMAALEKEADKIAAILGTATDYDILEGNIELLDGFAYRIYEKAFSVAQSTLERLKNIQFTYGEVPGFREEEIKRFRNRSALTIRLLTVLKNIRYHLPDKNLQLFLEYTIDEHEDVRKEAESCLKAIAAFDLNIFYKNEKGWGGLGPEPQEKALACLEDLSSADKEKYFNGVIILADSLLSPSIEGSTWSYKKVIMSTGAVPAFPKIKEIRTKTIKILKEMYVYAESSKKKLIITSTLRDATRTSHAGKYGDDVGQMILENTMQVLDVYRQIAANETDMEIIQHIEDLSYWLHHNRDNEHIQTAALKVKAVIDQNAEYQIFKVLIGFDGVFVEWRVPGKTREEEDKLWDSEYKQTESIRTEGMKKFAENITAVNYSEWEARILCYSKIESNDMATFPFFAKFLEHFGKISPELALTLLQKHADELQWFVTFIFWGVWETGLRDQLRQMVVNWINAGKFLVPAARIFEYRKDLDLELLNLILAKAKETSDREKAVPALRALIAVIASNYDCTRKRLVNTIFIDVVKELTARSDGNGVLHIWFRKEVDNIVADMDASALDALMENLLLARKIDYQAEHILTSIASRSPEKVIEFFGQRLVSKDKGGRGSDYEAFPFQFHSLQTLLSQIPGRAVDIISGWYDGNYGMFIYGGGKFLYNIFPDFPKPFEQKLIELVHSADHNKVLFILAVLRHYDGAPSVHGVCKELIKILPAESEELHELTLVLESTGVVAGEYGFVEAYERKKEEIKGWLDDQDEKVRLFAAKYHATLDRLIVDERKRSDERTALQKFRFGGSDDE